MIDNGFVFDLYKRGRISLPDALLLLYMVSEEYVSNSHLSFSYDELMMRTGLSRSAVFRAARVLRDIGVCESGRGPLVLSEAYTAFSPTDGKNRFRKSIPPDAWKAGGDG